MGWPQRIGWLRTWLRCVRTRGAIAIRSSERSITTCCASTSRWPATRGRAALLGSPCMVRRMARRRLWRWCGRSRRCCSEPTVMRRETSALLKRLTAASRTTLACLTKSGSAAAEIRRLRHLALCGIALTSTSSYPSRGLRTAFLYRCHGTGGTICLSSSRGATWCPRGFRLPRSRSGAGVTNAPTSRHTMVGIWSGRAAQAASAQVHRHPVCLRHSRRPRRREGR